MTATNPLEVLAVSPDGTIVIRHTPKTNLELISKALEALRPHSGDIDQLKQGKIVYTAHEPGREETSSGSIAVMPRLGVDGQLEAIIALDTRDLHGALPDIVDQLQTQLAHSGTQTSRSAGCHDGDRPETLTSRQLAILEHMALGLTNKQIARHIAYSESTVRIETMSIYRKLAVPGREQAAAKARQLGLIAH